MVNLNDSSSVDAFLSDVIGELGLVKKLQSAGNVREIFSPGVHRFLDYAFSEGTKEEKTAVELDSNREWGKKVGLGFREAEETDIGNVTTMVFDVYQAHTKRGVREFEYDPILLLVYQTAKSYDRQKVLDRRNDLFGCKGIDLRKAREETLAHIGMVPHGCHAFPFPTLRPTYMWIDDPAPDLRRHSLYLNRTSQRVGYLDIENRVFRDLSHRMNPNSVGVEGLTISR